MQFQLTDDTSRARADPYHQACILEVQVAQNALVQKSKQMGSEV